MDVRIEYKYISRAEVDGRKEDDRFVKEPGLLIAALIKKQDRTKSVPVFIPRDELLRLIEEK